MKPGFLLIIVLIPTLSATAATRFEFSGTAASGGTELYTEFHQVQGTCSDGQFAPKEHRVSYQRAGSDSLFAEKHLSYGEAPFTPSVSFRQPDFSEQLDIDYPNESEISIRWQAPESAPVAYELSRVNNLVVDAGFDHFVRANWAALNAGESLSFQFLAPTRGEHYEFTLEPISTGRLDADLEVQIRPAGLLLRFLVDPILLGYRADGALTHYLGLTNIRKNTDTNHTAHIRYQVLQLPNCELTR
ncbi:hypothetical protein C7H09_04280 [Marinobacter fuscus]|uniref:Uncharacterized protein n=1 Tax=Marinobacter fuscus TaxID=2109942 RepID=A0A2T1KQ59_9GAMM|nr:hypothetical protein [Marinobacter fuscus]PSF12235.1 hypothetical protein C7H09_04280 [Marinobacter fuscus]